MGHVARARGRRTHELLAYLTAPCRRHRAARGPATRRRDGTAMGHGSATATAAAALCGAALLARGGGDVGALWHPPAQGDVNNLTLALGGRGVYGFIFNSSTTPDARYGTYNWCNMPHVRRAEYERAPAGFELKYVELVSLPPPPPAAAAHAVSSPPLPRVQMHRHHKRTPYASNGFPVEADVWDCDDVRLFLYGEPAAGPAPCRARRQGYTSAVNPFVAAGLRGSCSFPQITAEGLVDSWQHGADLYHVYHDLLGLLPARDDAHFGSAVRYRVTNNPITSQVAGMLISGMWRTADPAPLMIQVRARLVCSAPPPPPGGGHGPHALTRRRRAREGSPSA